MYLYLFTYLLSQCHHQCLNFTLTQPTLRKMRKHQHLILAPPGGQVGNDKGKTAVFTGKVSFSLKNKLNFTQELYLSAILRFFIILVFLFKVLFTLKYFKATPLCFRLRFGTLKFIIGLKKIHYQRFNQPAFLALVSCASLSCFRCF